MHVLFLCLWGPLSFVRKTSQRQDAHVFAIESSLFCQGELYAKQDASPSEVLHTNRYTRKAGWVQTMLYECCGWCLDSGLVGGRRKGLAREVSLEDTNLSEGLCLLKVHVPV